MRSSTLALWLLLCVPSIAGAQESPPVGREDAARAAFEHAASSYHADDLTIRVPVGPTLPAYVEALADAVEHAVRRATLAVERFQRVVELGAPHWTLAAWVEQARIYERLARAVREMPGDRRPSDAVMRLLEERLRPVECFAVERYVITARAARAGRLDTEASRAALDALRGYDERRIRACIDSAHERDPSFARLRSGELGHPSALPRNTPRR